MTIATILQVVSAMIIPIFVIRAAKRSKFVRTISPVVVCYLLGMLLGNQDILPFNQELALTMCGLLVALAIPLLLFSVDIVSWFRLAVPTVLGFFFATVSVLITASLGHFLFADKLPESAKMSAMLIGVYVGGTPNMNAIGVSLGIRPETFVMLNTTDMILSFIYLTFLMSLAGKVLKKIFKPFCFTDPPGDEEQSDQLDPTFEEGFPPWRDLLISLGLTLIIVAVGVGVKQFFSPMRQSTIAILVITTLTILASLSPRIRSLQGTQVSGQYLLLVFCVAIGTTTDFGKLLTSTSTIFLYNALVLVGAVGLHFLLCFLFRIDRDTTIITSTAAVFSPPFVGPVAMALKNREIIVSGIASGLVGYAISNYLGITLAWLLT